MSTPGLADFTLALDWTPNINHVGFFVAEAKGYYSANGLNVRIVSPHSDQYSTTPAQRIADGTAHVAICPSESVISYASQVRGTRACSQAVRCMVERISEGDRCYTVSLGKYAFYL